MPNVMNSRIQLHTAERGDFHYTVDLDQISFSEDGRKSWIQAMPLGNYNHPLWGEIKITSEKVQRFADNVNKGVRGQQLDIDYDHKNDPSKGSQAAGWVMEADARPDGLWLLVEWVKEAVDAIKEKKYRYFSPEFSNEWKHPESKVKFTDVLFGGALTNRPFLKGIAPIALSETNTEGMEYMNRKALEAIAKLHGIQFSEDTSDADLQAKVEEAAQEDDFGVSEEDVNSEDDSENTDSEDADDDDEDENEDEIAQLSESHPAVAALVKRLSIVEAGARLSETTLKLSELNSGDTQLSPMATAKLSDIMNKADEKTAEAVYDFAQIIVGKNGVVSLSEEGSSNTNNNNTGQDDFIKAVEKMVKENEGMSFSDASLKVAVEQPALWDAYNEETTFGGVN